MRLLLIIILILATIDLSGQEVRIKGKSLLEKEMNLSSDLLSARIPSSITKNETHSIPAITSQLKNRKACKQVRKSFRSCKKVCRKQKRKTKKNECKPLKKQAKSCRKQARKQKKNCKRTCKKIKKDKIKFCKKNLKGKKKRRCKRSARKEFRKCKKNCRKQKRKTKKEVCKQLRKKFKYCKKQARVDKKVCKEECKEEKIIGYANCGKAVYCCECYENPDDIKKYTSILGAIDCMFRSCESSASGGRPGGRSGAFNKCKKEQLEKLPDYNY